MPCNSTQGIAVLGQGEHGPSVELPAIGRSDGRSANNARFEGIESKASFKQSWQRGQRCIIPAEWFDEPCWETGRNVWWRFRRSDGE